MSPDQRKKETSSERSPASSEAMEQGLPASPLEEQTQEQQENNSEQKIEQASQEVSPRLEDSEDSDIDDDDAPTVPGLPAIGRVPRSTTPDVTSPAHKEEPDAASSTNVSEKAVAASEKHSQPEPQAEVSALPANTEEPQVVESKEESLSQESAPSEDDAEQDIPTVRISPATIQEATSPEAPLANESEEHPATQAEEQVTSASAPEEQSEPAEPKATPGIAPVRRPRAETFISTRQQRAVRAFEKRQSRNQPATTNTEPKGTSPAEQPQNDPSGPDITDAPTRELTAPEASAKPANPPKPAMPASVPRRPGAGASRRSDKKKLESPVPPSNKVSASESQGAEAQPGAVNRQKIAVAQREAHRDEALEQAASLSPEEVITASMVGLPDEELAQEYRRHLVRRHHRKILRVARWHIRRNHLQKKQTRNNVLVGAFSVLMVLLIVFLALSGTGAYFGYRFYSDTQGRYLGRVLSLHELLPKDNLKVYDSKGTLLGQLADNGVHTSVKLQDVSPDLVNATIAVEDKNFWTNPGVDIARILQAALDNLKSGHVVEGGSTITQQLIKKLVVGDKVDNVRKLEEIILTPQVNDVYTKQDIMEMYLNTIYYGSQAYGIDAAANMYFGLQDKPGLPASKQLDLAQAAMLAGLPQNGDYYNPWNYRARATDRMHLVLDLMVSQKNITKAQESAALKEAGQKDFFKHSPDMGLLAPHFFYFVLSQLQSMTHMSKEQLSRSDMKVTTTLDIALQNKIQKVMTDHTDELHTYGISNAAEVLMDQHTGAIISLLGSLDYNNNSIGGKFDVATQGWRQPGSSFKPYVYALAMQSKGTSPAQAVNDVQTRFPTPGAEDPYWEPKNYDLKYHGPMTLRCALQNSLNIPAVRVLQQVGINNAVDKAKEMDLSYEGTPGLSMVLGGLSVHLLDHVSAFGSFGNNGVHVPYYAVQKIEYMSTGKVIEHQQTKGKQVFSPQTAYMISNVLSDNQSRLPEFFDCNQLQLYSNSEQSCYAGDRGAVRPAAAKTGTTNDFRDNWTLGYTTDYVMGVWAGNNDNSPMSDGTTGVVGAAPIWHDAMLLAEKGKPIRDFSVPGGLVRTTATIDGITSTDWFYSDKVPSGYDSTNGQSWSPQSLLQDPTDNNQNPPPGGDKNKDKGKTKYTPYCPSFSYTGNPGAGGW
ncbi:transglycosylase domain-containing protein [Ktedonobacter sp. SOSP1-52]|uniref:transglycosylase domain-containing protein n=1 Tax=Ktedonobacter sp. SOSP1-52 TaxID=2778366 RepID=UPI0019161250|nr:transglycosylase domain-containing protein [Ktedonobacter sp. SOSP1-52]